LAIQNETTTQQNITVVSSTTILLTNDIGASPTPASPTTPQWEQNATIQLYMLCTGTTLNTCQTTGAEPRFETNQTKP
jgi:hypothetical protein